MSVVVNRTQIPLNRAISSKDGAVSQVWALWFRNLVEALPPVGSGFILDGSAATYAPMIVLQGLNINKGSSPRVGSIYFAVDTGQIFVESSGSWEEQTSMLTGDITKPASLNMTTLATVNPNPGTWGDQNSIPIFTVNEKGLITSVTTIPPHVVPASAGTDGQLQFNLAGALGAAASLTFDRILDRLTLNNLGVLGTIVFSNPLPTFNNLSPLTTKGDILVYGTQNTRLPIGVSGQVLHADPDSPSGVAWRNIDTFTTVDLIKGAAF